MKLIHTLMNGDRKTFSIELFPPKTEKGYHHLLETISAMVDLKPDFFSCTYGAGGSSTDKTIDIVEHIQNVHHIPTIHHLTCVAQTKNEIKNIIEEMLSRKINNILALRGDPPHNNPNWTPKGNNFQYSCELVAFIKKHFKDQFSIGVAGFPEGHILCKDLVKNAQYLKNKITHGANFVITQLFFDNRDYFDYLGRLQNIDVTQAIIPGIIPITDYKGLLRFTEMCGASVPNTVKEIFEPLQNNPEKTLKAGINFAIHQCQRLLASGAPGIHFYALNKIHPIAEILQAIR